MATIYQPKGSKVWYIQYTPPGQKRKKESLGQITRREAELKLKAKEIELETGTHPHQTHISQATTLPDLIPDILEYYKTRHPASYNRVKIFQNHLLSFFNHTPITQLTTADVVRYQAHRLQSISIATVNKEIGHLQKIIKLGLEWGALEYNPFLHKSIMLQNPEDKPHRYFTKGELKRIYAHHPASAPYWQILAGTGLRRKEALNLKWIDVKKDHMQVLSTMQRRNKTAKWRYIPLSQNVRTALNKIHNINGVHVFPQMDHRNFSRKFERLLQKLNIKNASLHTLRHTFCSHLVMNSVPLRTVQLLAGHSSIKITEGYAYLAPEHLQDAVAGLDL